MSNTVAKPSTKKYILVKGMHLGHIKQSFASGTVIDKHEDGSMTIDGKKFESSKDLEILLKHGWAEVFSAKRLAEIESKKTGTSRPLIAKQETKKNPMPVIESDSDLVDEINISHTKKAKEVKPEARKSILIKGNIKEEERIEILSKSIPKMSIVEDDGSLSSSASGPALNSGTVKVLTAEEREAKRLDSLKKLQQSAKIVELQSPEQAATGETAKLDTTELFEEAGTVATTEKAQEAEVVNSEPVVATEAPKTDAPKKGRGRPKGAPNKPKVAPEAPMTPPQEPQQ